MTGRLRDLYVTARALRAELSKATPDAQRAISGHVERMKLQAHTDVAFRGALYMVALEIMIEDEEKKAGKR